MHKKTARKKRTDNWKKMISNQKEKASKRQASRPKGTHSSTVRE
jgi:hypothetical protein